MITWTTEATRTLNPKLRPLWVLLNQSRESDEVDVLAIWKQARAAMNQQKFSRGLKTLVYRHSNSTSVTRNFRKPDLA